MNESKTTNCEHPKTAFTWQADDGPIYWICVDCRKVMHRGLASDYGFRRSVLKSGSDIMIEVEKHANAELPTYLPILKEDDAIEETIKGLSGAQLHLAAIAITKGLSGAQQISLVEAWGWDVEYEEEEDGVQQVTVRTAVTTK